MITMVQCPICKNEEKRESITPIESQILFGRSWILYICSQCNNQVSSLEWVYPGPIKRPLSYQDIYIFEG